METNQSQYEKMCEVYERYNKGDLVPVVRCKDCEKWDTIECPFVKCDGLKFCAWGERREDSEPVKHGHWEWNDYGGFGNYHCTECGYIPFKYIPCVKFQRKLRPDYNYCPNCGAKMEEEDATETGG